MSALCLLSLYFVVLKTEFCQEGMTVLVSKTYMSAVWAFFPSILLF